MSKKQLLRLIRLVAQLKENRYPNCSSFAATMRKADLEENLNVSCTPKTIFRDIQTLKNDFEAPIKFDNSRNGYYLTRHDWTFSSPQIYEDSEMLAAVIGARVSEHIFPSPMREQIRNAVDQLLTYHNPEFLKKTQVDSLVIIPSNRTMVNAEVCTGIFYAWQNHNVCHVEYKDSKGNCSERDFEPHALIFFDGVWYAKGFCRSRKEMRTLVLPRIQNITVTTEEFTPDPAIIKTANEEGIFDPEMVEDVVVQCDSYLTNIIQTRPLHPEQKIVLTDTGCELHVKKMSKYRLITWIMHQCGRAEVLFPVEKQAKVAEFAEKIFLRHNKKVSTCDK